ncbi:CsbD family protein [Alsobacter sp. SYSU M60028]|uniref:CsbD family protein n=1 Tax=Alsobacter ponti TaxID=2962936 RepID=A0ABT1LDL2_9HYPH|nr:CsbD family protein [Alsobacter ponti]MCP8939602.1 CsbD family protein [Alsobacter ponti]
MDKQHIKGAMDKAKGAAKDAVGKVTGDDRMQAEGKMDKAKGEARQAVGDVKDAVRKSTR